MRLKFKHNKGEYTKRANQRLRNFIRLLRKSYKSMPEDLKNKNLIIYVDNYFREYPDSNISAYTDVEDGSITFFLKNHESYPDMDSLNWNMCHELCHFKLRHIPVSEKSNLRCEREAVTLGEQYGYPWKDNYRYTSDAC